MPLTHVLPFVEHMRKALLDRKQRILPPQHIANEDCSDQTTLVFFRRAFETGQTLVVDTEYGRETKYLTICGIGCVFPMGLEVLSIDYQDLSYAGKTLCSHLYRTLVRQLPVVFHNAMADIPVLEKALGVSWKDYKAVDDTMLAHAILWSELPHDLEFLESIYGEYGEFKHLRDTDQLRYNYGDVITTACVWKEMVRGFASDGQAEAIYRQQSLALLPMLLQSAKTGIRVNIPRVIEEYTKLQQIAQKVKHYAELAVGYPINLNSGTQLKHYLYEERGLPVQINRKSKQPTTDDDAIACLRTTLGPVFDTGKELTYDQDTDRSYSILRRVTSGADPILECRALWAGIWQVVNNYIIGLGKGVYGESSQTKRKATRSQYWEGGYRPDRVVPRVYPQFAIHAQKTGRWSTTHPPLAQLPASLRDLVCPDEGEVCLQWDWKAIEPRILQALCGSTLLKKVFEEGIDLHTWTVCSMFGYEMPPDLVNPHKAASCEAWRVKYHWLGSDDPRRVFAKQCRYEMYYGGSGSNAAHAATQFGLDTTTLRMALTRLATADTQYYAWKVALETEIKHTSLIRTFMGRPRRFLSTGRARQREGQNQPMQGGVSDIFNTTAVALFTQHTYLRWGYGMHDSQKWYVKEDDLTYTRFNDIRRIVEQPYLINKQVTQFPAEFEIILSPELGSRKFTPEQYFMCH